MVHAALLAAVAQFVLTADPLIEVEQALQEQKESLRNVHVRYVVKSEVETEFDFLKAGESRRVTYSASGRTMWKSFDGTNGYAASWNGDKPDRIDVVAKSASMPLSLRNELSPLLWAGVIVQGQEGALVDWLPDARPLGESKREGLELFDYDLGGHALLPVKGLKEAKAEYGLRLSKGHGWAPAVITQRLQLEGEREFTYEVTEFREIRDPARKRTIHFPWKMKSYPSDKSHPPMVVETTWVVLDPPMAPDAFEPPSMAGARILEREIP